MKLGAYVEMIPHDRISVLQKSSYAEKTFDSQLTFAKKTVLF